MCRARTPRVLPTRACSATITDQNEMHTAAKLLSAHGACAIRPAHRCALGVMIRTPRVGASKTRLVPPLTPAEAAALSVCFLRDTAANICAAAATAAVIRAGGAAGVAVYTPVGSEHTLAGLVPAQFRLLAQRGADLSARLQQATTDLLRAGYESLCLLGADSPTLPRALLVAAVTELARAGDRIVLGPAHDGGYYLIGLKRAHLHLFTEIDWSTERVLAQTIARAEELKLEVGLLPAWYDVDDASALARLCAELGQAQTDRDECSSPVGYSAPHTRALLAELLAGEGRARIWPAASDAAA
jgi:rSAM/selenodomain-associated transferase 1